MTVFNYAEFHLKVRTDILPTNDDAVVTDAFFEKATLVLLNVPDWCCISAYVLLIVVCAEALLQVTSSRSSSSLDSFLSLSFLFWIVFILAVFPPYYISLTGLQTTDAIAHHYL